MSSALASQTLARIQQALRDRETASLPEVIKLIEELSNRAFSISVQELADLISRDTMVTAKVIQTANTFGYNPFGVTVTTVSQAIQVVGFNKIRNLALSMLLIDKAMGAGQSEALRESAALALCSGLFAQALTTIHPEQDSEQAFVFACLRHYGRLLLTTFFSTEFQQIHQRPIHETEADACRRVFGITPLELTHHLFEESRLPRTILRCLQEVPPAQMGQTCATPEEQLTAITHFAAALGEIVVSSRVSAAGFADEADKLRERFATKLELSPDSIPILLRVVDQNVRAFTHTYGTKAVASGVMQRITERSKQAEPLPSLGEATHPAPPPEPAGPPSAAAMQPTGNVRDETQPDSIAILTECLIQLAELGSANAIDLSAMEAAIIDATRRALVLQDCVLFQRDPGSITYSAQTGQGALLDLVRGRPLISTERRDVFSICLTRREDVLIRDISDPKIRPFIPDWILSAGNISGFILLPLLNETGVTSLIVGTRAVGRQLQPTVRELQMMKAVRQHLMAAYRLATS